MASVNTGMILDLNGKIMTDIYDIKTDIFIFPINIYISLFYIIIFFTLYFLYKKYKVKKINKKEIKQIIIKKPNYKKILKNIETNFIKEDKNKFYAKLGDFIRNYLDTEKEFNLSTKTLSELKNKIDLDLYYIIESIYFPEYDYKKDDELSRREILVKIKDYIK